MFGGIAAGSVVLFGKPPVRKIFLYGVMADRPEQASERVPVEFIIDQLKAGRRRLLELSKISEDKR